MVEVYKTNVKKRKQAKLVVKKLRQEFPQFIFDFDLEDCDKILRVENPKGFISDDVIFVVFNKFGLIIEVLPETLSIQNLTNSQSKIISEA